MQRRFDIKLIQEISWRKNIFRDDYKKEVRNKTMLKQMVSGEIRQTYDLMLVVQIETTVFFLGNRLYANFPQPSLFLVLDRW